MFCDMRNSTRLADILSRYDYLELLNAYFECAAGAVVDHGGEVLKFIGDGVMAMFPIDRAERSASHAARAAVAAARQAVAEAHERSATRRQRGGAAIDIGVSLHIGDLAYGNVGLPGRLDFTVIGPSANVVTRLQELCKLLDVPIVASADLATVSEVAFASLGKHALRGVEEPVEVFAVAR